MRRFVRTPLLFTLALAPALWGQDGCRPLAPCYSTAGLVNSASGEAGFLAPYTFATLYGTNLSYSERGRTTEDALPGIGGVNVLIGGLAAMIFYASPTQVNFLVPVSIRAGEVTLQITRDGDFGPILRVRLAEFAPALFCIMQQPDQVVAQRMPDFALATPEAPARPGEYVILYATGLGNYAVPVGDDVPPPTVQQIQWRQEFQLLLDGVPVDNSRVEYVGSVVHYWGLIQINLKLPERISNYPEIRIAIGTAASRAGVRLAVQPE
jgi:uncharacterized protein (TIGR03437 family)